MIKFLHTADLHLGKVFHEHSLVEDQEYMLEQLAEVLTDESYRALLIAGDVYDRSIPSPDAVSLFGGFLGKLKLRRPGLNILVIPGNHDSSSRLGFGKELFAELGIHFVTRPEDATRPVLVSDGQERCAFFLLPFLSPGSLSAESADGEGEPIRSQAALAAEAAARLEAARLRAVEAGADYTALAAHLFTAGGVESESERIFLGTAERVPAELFVNFDYAALGHLHRFQRAGTNAWYSGSPLAYSFDEGEYGKVFLSVELDGDGARVDPIPVRPRRMLRRLRGPFNYFFEDPDRDPVLKEAENDYLEIVLTGTRLTENPLALLGKRFPWVLSIKQEAAFAGLAGETGREDPREAEPGKRRTITEDFTGFLIDIYGREDPAKLALFRELLAETAAEESGTGEGGV